VRGRLTFSNVVACLAPLRRPGGAGYCGDHAAEELGRRTQLKKHSVTQWKLAAALLEALKGAPPRGP
jgi:hypothetical protein